ncbi:MAG: SDR family oxidoreductase [Bacteroidales bacterium]
MKILVTGGAGGIGKAICARFLKAGYSVIITDKDVSAGKQFVEGLDASGGKLSFIGCDIANPPDVKEMIRHAAGEEESIDILVNNAATAVNKSPEELDIEEWDHVLNTNLRGAFLCSREAVRFMKKNKRGKIINIASTRAFMSEPNTEAYSASKGGLVALTHALAASLSLYNIQVNCISPGWIENNDYAKLRELDHKQHFSGRVGKPEDIAEGCLFLAGNDFINGENIIIDGGMTRKMIYEP